MSRVFSHKPVMLNEVLSTFEYLKNSKSTVFVDGTIGLAGHSLAITKEITKGKPQNTNNRQASNNKIQIIGIDKDKEALEIAEKKYSKSRLTNQDHLQGGLVVDYVHDDFCNIKDILGNLGINKVDGILLDLGVSSMQLDDKSRGFSFEDPKQLLDMRMDKTQHKDAEYILNNYSKYDLENVLKNGEEKFYKKITGMVIEARKVNRIKTVGELLSIVEKAYPLKLKAKKINFATDTFRALRLEVNDEISGLERTVEDMISTLSPGGKLAIITFHSLEDRIVKHKYRALENPCVCPPKQPYCTCGKKASLKVLTKKPIIPSNDEVAENPRARSAKLRIAKKI